jgi:hypothetical protein
MRLLTRLVFTALLLIPVVSNDLPAFFGPKDLWRWLG